MQGKTRREFIQASAVLGGAVTLGGNLSAQAGSTSGIPTRVLGRTGVPVSILCLGGWHIGAVKEKTEAIKIMHAALDEGITFFDNAWDYHNGKSEDWMGEALAQGGKRNKVFLMTKNCERDYAGSMRNLEESLRRLKTDRLDLWQFHEMVYDNDPDWVFEKGGLKAALEAKKAGKVRFIGFTGHKDPRIHLKMLNKPYDWDSAQMPINVMDAHYRSFQNEVVPVCLAKQVGIIGMKSLGGGSPRARIPMQGGVSAEDCIRFALTLSVSTLVVGIESMDDLKQDLAIARNFKPMSDGDKATLLSRIREEASDGRHELFKSTKAFDGPHHRRQHGFDTGLA
jgi:aryl-alcohol dehydrogenase-like predicted oxidoreductase